MLGFADFALGQLRCVRIIHVRFNKLKCIVYVEYSMWQDLDLNKVFVINDELCTTKVKQNGCMYVFKDIVCWSHFPIHFSGGAAILRLPEYNALSLLSQNVLPHFRLASSFLGSPRMWSRSSGW